jgi:hypothetical protein
MENPFLLLVKGPEDFSLVGIKVRRPVPSTWSCSVS